MDILNTAIILIFTISLTALSYLQLRHKKKLSPPSPPALPIIGHLHILKTASHLALQKLFIKYGPLVYLRFGACPILVVSSPSLANECFTKSNDVIFANRPESITGRFLGYNNTALIVTPYGDHWRNLRRVTTIHVFSSVSLHRFSSVWTEEIQFMMKKMFSGGAEDAHGWKVANMKTVFQELMFNVIMKMMAGKRWPADQQRASFVPQAVSNICDYIPILRRFGYGGLEKGMISVHENRDKFAQDLIEETRKAGSSSSEAGRKTIMQIMLSLQEAEPDYYTDDIIKGIMMVMFAAGTHTSSQTMEWAMSFMLNNYEILQKARNEMENNLAEPEKLIEDTDIPKLPYLRCIINETLRLCPPAPTLVPHYSSEECTIGGFKVAKGTTLHVNAWAIHRDPEIWEDADKFIPERFEEIDEKGFTDGSKFLPFGKGRRACPGSTMAMRLVGMSLGALIQCFEWHRVGTEMVNLEEKLTTTLGKAIPLEARYKPRESMIDFLSQL